MDLTVLNQAMAAAGATGGANPNAYDLSKAVSMPGTYDLTDITETTWTLSTDGNITREIVPTALAWGDNGKYFFHVGQQGGATSRFVQQYETVTPYVISGMTYLGGISVATQETGPNGLAFKPDGTKMYVTGTSGDDINEYSLSTAWDVTTASFDQNFSFASQDTAPSSPVFKPDGTKLFITGTTNDNVYEYSLSTPWDVSTLSYVQSFSVSSQSLIPRSIDFKPDGTKMFLVDYEDLTNAKIYQYSLSTAWDISTASYDSISLNPSFLTTAEWFLFDFLFDGTGGTITLGVFASAVEPNRFKVYQQWAGGSFFDTAAQDNNPDDIYIKPDGTKMYVLGGAGDDVLEYDLSTPFDASTASYVQNFVVTSQEATPKGLFFKPDGTKFYICGETNDTVYQYSLSVAWDISTASYDSISKSVSAQETQPHGLAFKNDGTKMYIVGPAGDAVFEYDLSTAWDVSSASYLQSFSVASQETSPRGLAFSQDGSYMFVCGPTADAAFKYTLSTPWDVSTASLSQTMKLFSLIENVSGMTFDPTGTYLYFTDISKDIVAQFQIPST